MQLVLIFSLCDRKRPKASPGPLSKSIVVSIPVVVAVVAIVPHINFTIYWFVSRVFKYKLPWGSSSRVWAPGANSTVLLSDNTFKKFRRIGLQVQIVVVVVVRRLKEKENKKNVTWNQGREHENLPKLMKKSIFRWKGWFGSQLSFVDVCVHTVNYTSLSQSHMNC